MAGLGLGAGFDGNWAGGEQRGAEIRGNDTNAPRSEVGMSAFLSLRSRVVPLAAALALCACRGSDPDAITAGERAATAKAVESV